MAPRFAILLCGFAAAGCGADGAAVEPTSSSALPAPQVVQPRGPIEPESVGLFRDQSAVRVGDAWEHAKEVFPEPARGTYPLRDLPASLAPGAPPHNFDVNGWETAKGEGFGVILLGGRVVVAMYQLEHARLEDVQQAVALQKAGMDGMTPTFLKRADGLTYWFWPGRTQTLMVCARPSRREKELILTEVMGDDNVLATIHATRADAEKLGAKPATERSARGANVSPFRSV